MNNSLGEHIKQSKLVWSATDLPAGARGVLELDISALEFGRVFPVITPVTGIVFSIDASGAQDEIDDALDIVPRLRILVENTTEDAVTWADTEINLRGLGAAPRPAGHTRTLPDTLVNAPGVFSIEDEEGAVVASIWASLPSVATTADLADSIASLESDTTTALASKADLVDGIVPSGQLPSYVDDVLEFDNFASLPGAGVSGKIYVTLDDNKTYRWSGSAYVVISETIALGETAATAYRGDRGKTAYDHSQLTSANPHGTDDSNLNAQDPTNASALATLRTVLTNINDRFAAHGKFATANDWTQANTFAASIMAGSYLRVGNTAAPTNTTAGDITAARLMLGTDATFSSLNTDQVYLSNANTGVAGTAYQMNLTNTYTPPTNSAQSNRTLYVSARYAGSVNFSGASYASYLENRFLGGVDYSSTVAALNLTNIWAASPTATFGTMAQVTGILMTPFQANASSVSAGTNTITSLVGIDIASATTGANPITVTGSTGLTIRTVNVATNNTYILLGQSTIPAGNYGIYSGTTNISTFAGALLTASYLRVGAGTAPTNTTAGDITATRLIIGSPTTNLTTASIDVAYIQGANTATTGTLYHSQQVWTLSPASASNATYRGMYFSTRPTTAQNFSGVSIVGYFEHRFTNAGAGANATFVSVFGANVWAGLAASTFGTISSLVSFRAQPLQMNVTSLTSGTISNTIGYEFQDNLLNSNPVVLTNNIGILGRALSSGTNNTAILLGFAATVPTGNWTIYSYSTNSSYLAGSLGIGGTPTAGYILEARGATMLANGAATGALNIGADVNATTRTATTRKLAVIAMPDYAGTRNIEIFSGDSSTAAINQVNIGGRNGATSYSATEVNLVTNSDPTTTGGTVRVKADHGSGADTTGLSLYDVNSTTLKRVVVGAADSGGAGFRLLRIAN